MSATLLGAVFYLDLPQNEKLMLLAMADHASDDGHNVFPGTSRLAQKTSVTERAARRALTKLADRGYIRTENRKVWRGNPVVWEVDAARIYGEAREQGWTQKRGTPASAFPDRKGDVADIKGDAGVQEGGHQRHEKAVPTWENDLTTIINHQEPAAAAGEVETDPDFLEFNLARARADAEEQRRAGTKVRSVGGLAKAIAARTDFQDESRHLYDHRHCPKCVGAGTTTSYTGDGHPVAVQCTYDHE